jgi:hypothetical protein
MRMGGPQIMNVILIHKRIDDFNVHMQKWQHNGIVVINGNRYRCKFRSDYSTAFNGYGTEAWRGQDDSARGR